MSAIVIAAGTAFAGSSPGASASVPSLSPKGAELQSFYRLAAAAKVSASRLAAQDGDPACPKPPLPPPLSPNGTHGYEVPFVAAVKAVHLAAGYSEWIANHTSLTVGNGADKRAYTLYPWQSSVSGVTGWVSGYLQLPALTAKIPASNIEFCQSGGAEGPTSCFNPTPTPGECISIALTGSGFFFPKEPPQLVTTNVPLEPATLTGPSSLGPGQSATYTFTGQDRTVHAGIAATFSADSPSGPLSAAGTVYYNGYPWDSYPGQFLKLSNVKINGVAAGSAPGPSVTPGSTLKVSGTITNPSTVGVDVTGFGAYGPLPPIPPIVLAPGASTQFSFTQTAQAGARDVMIFVRGTDNFINVSAFSLGTGAFGAAYYTGGSVPAGLKVSNELVQVSGASQCPGTIVAPNWCPAAKAPGPNVGSQAPTPTYAAQVTLTNTTGSTVTNIVGTTAGAPCLTTYGCVQYVVVINPYEDDTNPSSPCYRAAATLAVTGVDPVTHSIQVQGTACSETTLQLWLSPTLFFTGVQTEPTVVTVSSQGSSSFVPPAGPTPPNPGNPDYRGLQFPIQGLEGPLQSASGSIGSNNFQIPAFSGPEGGTVNAAVSGFDSQGNANYTSGPIAGQPGWNQFVADTSVAEIGLPIGLPAGFTW